MVATLKHLIKNDSTASFCHAYFCDIIETIMHTRTISKKDAKDVSVSIQ